MSCRIVKLEIQGFRAFGNAGQTLELPSLLAAVWGPNSQGKTSLAEAVEFLLTGQIVRRALMASSQDEFADALRNAHLPADAQAFVRATIACADRSVRTVTRILKADYSKKQDCETILQIDGKAAIEADLAALGIVLSQPPLRAPVLAQHTLGYVFSARPQDRASYFKALLEVTDLEEFRTQVAGLEKEIAAPADPLIGKLETAGTIAGAGKHLARLLARVPTPAELADALAACCKELIEAHGDTAPEDHKERFTRLEALLAEKRSKTFALKGFDRKPLPDWPGPGEAELEKLDTYIAERKKVDAEARRLTSLFREALALPEIAAAEGDADCPLCGSEAALTPARMAFIRSRVADTEAFQNALKEAGGTLGRMQALAKSARDGIMQALPLFIANPSRFRRARGFRVERIRFLLGEEADAEVAAWLSSLRVLARAGARALAGAGRLSKLSAAHAENPDSLADSSALKAEFSTLRAAYDAFAAALSAYDALAAAIVDSLTAVVDSQSETVGWQELIDLAADKEGLRTALIDHAAREQAGKDLTQALRQIDKGNEAVLDEKFTELSGGVQKWWDLLRPDELSFFSGVAPRPGARRTIDFKAGLSAKADRSDPKLRDVIAVFSQSQLHCLGLALFLARAAKEKAGFIVLDDPIISSDEDYRAFFNAMVLEELLRLGTQVIVLTQDQRTWKDLGERYLHQNISMFQIALLSPADGSSVTNTADDLATQLTRAEKLARGGHPTLRKQGGEVMRDAAERFCKEMLVKDRRAKGDGAASLLDYDKKTLGHLGPQVEPLLTQDPSHPGKLRALGSALNPAKHDDAIPSMGTLVQALGDLQFLKKKYL
ncbi:ATP-binding protein [Bradyrhizobium sp. CCBAU 53421]|uniref:AAA family ATPase n=1 Tax=Bradyrhizobium sp. CCBAU 53421 TaxID=1325120 RepID=UPI00188AB866|nr:ATP-binding protein [Bradyrhizobium sp. CCBAU 53421]QOZ36995.1 hypothetical protein XH92_40095 [Bradyrhizobium sp. CCBAU 53421]